MWHHGSLCIYIAESLFYFAFFRTLLIFSLSLFAFFHSGGGRTCKDNLKTLVLIHKLTYSVASEQICFFLTQNPFLVIYIFITLDASHIYQLQLGLHLN